ncbi:MAG: glycosyltransferase family 4 protein [Nostoc sp. DedQUE11]|nr:glycosyltransferase family 4 protein [Nostoc sp. DedQUE11]
MKELKVVSLSDLQTNHYKDLLINNLNEQTCYVEDYLPQLIFLPKVIQKFQPQVLHLHILHPFFFSYSEFKRWVKFLIFIIQICILKLMGVKIVWTVHEWTDRFANGKNNMYRIWTIIIGKLLSAIIVHCNTTKIDIEKAFYLTGKEKVFLISHGNYIGSYQNNICQVAARNHLKIFSNKTVFLLFGNIHRTKGFLEAIDAFKELKETDIHLLIVGNPAEDDVVNLIKSKIENLDNILFLPKLIPDQEIQIYMNACDCVIVPYKVFTTSGVTVLAMSFAKACIAPNVGFFNDVLDEFGAFLYDPNDREGLLSAMKNAIKKSSFLSEMGKYNFELVQKWDWNYVARETVNIYRKN